MSYRIKPLEWERLSERRWKAAHGLEICAFEHLHPGARFICYLSSGVERHPTLADAKAACEASYRRQAERFLERVEGGAGDASEDDLIRAFTAVMRNADHRFEETGGGTRHYVRDLLLPMLREAGVTISLRAAIDAARKGEA